MTLSNESANWQNTVALNEDIVERFTAYVNADAELSAHRDFIEAGYGFGERAFHWLWKLIVDEMPESFRFLEIGVFKGAIPSLIRLLATRTGKQATIVGVTPLSSFGGDYDTYPDDDYLQNIKDLHDHFDQPYPRIVEGDSTDPKIQRAIGRLSKFDAIYIDGCHDYDYVVKDLLFYGSRLKEGGLLVVDDSANYLAPVWGFYQGILNVSNAVRAVIETDTAWEHRLAVMHDRIWQKVKPVGIGRPLEPIQRYRWVGTPKGNVAVKVD